MGTMTAPSPGSQQPSPEATAARKELKTLIDKQFEVYNRGTIAWSAVYNSCLVVALISSAAAAIVVKVDVWKAFGPDAVAICAGASALLNALIVGGGFDRKWRVNRTARSKIKQLQVDLADYTSSLPDLRSQFKKIVDDQDMAVMGPH